MDLRTVLDDIKKQTGTETNGELARALGINTKRIGEYYSGKRAPTDDEYALIALKSGRRIDELQAIVKLTSAKNEKTRQLWSEYYKSIGGIAASVALMVFTSCILIVTPTHAEASTLQALNPYHFVLCLVAMIFAYLNRQLQLSQVRLKTQLCMSVF